MNDLKETAQEVLKEQEEVISTFDMSSFISDVIQGTEQTQTLLKSVADHYGLENEAEASLKMAFNMLQDKIAGADMPELKREAYRELIEATNHFAQASEELTGNKLEDITAEKLQEMIGDASEQEQSRVANELSAAMDQLSSFLSSDAYNDFIASITKIQEYILNYSDGLIEQAKEFSDLVPYLRMVVDAEYPDLAFEDLINQYQSGDINETANEILEKAKKKQAEYISGLQTIEAAEVLQNLPRIKYYNSKELKTVTDKLANVFFSLNAPISEMDINGQYAMIPLKYEGKKSKKEVTLMYAPVFDESVLTTLGLKMKFDAYDFFVMSTLDNLKCEGNEVVSLTKIWHEMGGTGSPNPEQLTDLYNSIRKGISTTLIINNKDVLAAWGQDVSSYKELISPAMPVQMLTEKFTANGKTAAGMVKINSYSPFFTVAQPLGHYTTWNKEVLQLYKGRRTSRYYTVLRYLMTQIGWMLNNKSKRNNKIALQSLYSYAGDKNARAKQLTKKMAYQLLDEVFIPTGYISSYKEDAQDGGICLFWEKQKNLANKKKILPPPSRK